MIGRMFRPAVRKRARRVLHSLPSRMGMLFVVGAFPLVVLHVVRGLDKAGAFLVFVATALGITVVVAGTELAIRRPLRRLGGAMDQWRASSEFTVGNPPLPQELRQLAIGFKRSVLALGRREAQLRAALEQQELAMQEIHHRVKNNLQVVASLLNLQASRIRVPAAKAEFQAARDRVRALATVHRHLYAHGEVHTINMRDFLVELCGQLFQALGETEGERLTLEIEAPELQMSSDQAVPLALIVTEAVTNAVKYAYPAGRRGTIAVRLREEEGSVNLEISDDGIGIQLIHGFARQLGGTLEVEEGNGTRYRVRTKLRRAREPEPPA